MKNAKSAQKEWVKLTKIQKKNNEVKYLYDLSDKLKKYIKGNVMTIEYDYKIEDIPDSILIVPFLCNILPISWILDAIILIDEIDKSFYESIKEFKRGYIEMYPEINFLGELKADKIVKNSYEDGEKSLCFFSGGVDAMSTLINHINENISTLTLWGADIKTSNETGWSNVKKFILDNTPGVKNRFVKSNFRDIINETELNKIIRQYVEENWWHGFQHGIALIGHAAPICYSDKIINVYIASSYSEGVKATCASDPTIDNFVRFGSTKIHHDGYNFTRQEKVDMICKYNSENSEKLKLRVCWKTDEGNNCSECEKCIRTIMAIKANGENPKDYGFNPNYKKIKLIMENKIYFDNSIFPLWKEICDKFQKEKDYIKNDNDVNWFFNFDLNKANKKYKRIDIRAKRVIKRILKIQ